jgi:hypothetical protein
MLRETMKVNVKKTMKVNVNRNHESKCEKKP